MLDAFAPNNTTQKNTERGEVLSSEAEIKVQLMQLIADLKSRNKAVRIGADISLDELVHEHGSEKIDSWMEELETLFNAHKPKSLREACQLVRANQS